MLILGVVQTITEEYLEIALPGKLKGIVPKENISKPYNKAKLEGIEVKPLEKLFKRGQNVCVKVMSGDKRSYLLSMNPVDLNADKLHNLLHKGLVICGAVSDIEDHGYTIDLGIKHVRSFLPMEKAKNLKFSIGSIVNGVISEVTTTATTSTVILKTNKNNEFGQLEMNAGQDPMLDLITPGTVVPFNLTRILKNGLQGKLFDTFMGYVNDNYLTEPLHRPNDYTIGLQFEARLLYTMPLTKNCYLSMNFTKPQFLGDDGILARGHIVEEAISQGRSGNQILLKLNKNAKGVLSIKNIKKKFTGNYDDKTAMMAYSKVTKHRVRVVDYNPVERVYICTDNEAILAQQYFSITDIAVGDIVEAKIVSHKKGYVAKIGNIKGFLHGFDCSSGKFLIYLNLIFGLRII